jgi:hypothetical protein
MESPMIHSPDVERQIVANCRALCSQFNEAMRKATEEGYEVSLKNTPHLSSSDVAYPVVSVRFYLEIEPTTAGEGQ